VIASMRGLFLRAAFPSPADMGQYFSTMSYIGSVCSPSEFKSGGPNIRARLKPLPVQLL
jgi:hypothetical protein